MTRQLLIGMTVCIAFSGITCAPHDEKHNTAPPQPNVETANGDPADSVRPELPKQAMAQVPDAYMKRIDAARETIRRRHPLTSHGFWTVFHYILGVGPHNAMLRDDDDPNKLVNAVEFICAGKELNGLVFEEKRDGTVNVVTLAGSGVGQGHQDQFVAEMTQWGMPLDKVFMIKGNRHTFADFVRHSKQNASLGKRQELSWAVLIIAEHYPELWKAPQRPSDKWTNTFEDFIPESKTIRVTKEELSLEDIVRYEIAEPINPTTTCGGTHRLFDLAWVYFRHRERGGKKEGVWKDAVDYLDKYKKLAKEYQNKDGTFSTKYVAEPGNDADPELRVNTTGHVLEWLALYLSDAELREPWVLYAVDELCKLLLQNANRTFDGGSYYHAAHALEIYRTRVFGAADAHPPVIPPVPKD
jgi:hypothetical protein